MTKMETESAYQTAITCVAQDTDVAYKFVFGLEVGLTRLVKVRMVTNSSAAEG
jgi:hypothetical protein